MQPVMILIACLLGLLALTYVLYPLWRVVNVHQTETVPAAPETGEREAAARSALQEVELDYQLGNLAEADYRGLRERYMQRALVEMKQRYEREKEIDELIEER